MTDDVGHKYFICLCPNWDNFEVGPIVFSQIPHGTKHTKAYPCLAKVTPQGFACSLSIASLPCCPDLISPLHCDFPLGKLLIPFTLIFVSESGYEAYVTQFQELQHIINRKSEGDRDSRGRPT